MKKNKQVTNKENLENIDRNDKEVVIFGCHRIGGLILRDLNNHKRNLMVVDYNPQIIKSLINKDIPCIYGDFMHEEILEKISLLLAPYAPYISEYIYNEFNEASVHLSKWPKLNKKAIDNDLESQFGYVL